MDEQHETVGVESQNVEDARLQTRRGVIERLADPYLTDHDRWVLGQFARFLDGLAPGPDPRATPGRSRRPLPPRTQGANLWASERRQP